MLLIIRIQFHTFHDLQSLRCRGELQLHLGYLQPIDHHQCAALYPSASSHLMKNLFVFATVHSKVAIFLEILSLHRNIWLIKLLNLWKISESCLLRVPVLGKRENPNCCELWAQVTSKQIWYNHINVLHGSMMPEDYARTASLWSGVAKLWPMALSYYYRALFGHLVEHGLNMWSIWPCKSLPKFSTNSGCSIYSSLWVRPPEAFFSSSSRSKTWVPRCWRRTGTHCPPKSLKPWKPPYISTPSITFPGCKKLRKGAVRFFC